ncbi:MAG: hypothetical protein LBK98_10355 [Peptococcaceae bacterium]|jgi:hypothetical protein|nr:hypothetical protein [Peptococcaceae bacterium]
MSDAAMEIADVDAAREYWLYREIDTFDAVLLLPDSDEAWNARLEAAFAAKLRWRGRRGTVIRGEDARRLLALYSLYEFTDKLIIGSLDAPPGRKLRNLLDSGVASAGTLIDDVILGSL